MKSNCLMKNTDLNFPLTEFWGKNIGKMVTEKRTEKEKS